MGLIPFGARSKRCNSCFLLQLAPLLFHNGLALLQELSIGRRIYFLDHLDATGPGNADEHLTHLLKKRKTLNG